MNHFFIIEVVLLTASHDNDLFRICELPESACVYQGLQYSSWDQQGKRAGPGNLSLNKVLPAIDLQYRDSHFRPVVRFEFQYSVVDCLRQGIGGKTSSLKLPQKL